MCIFVAWHFCLARQPKNAIRAHNTAPLENFYNVDSVTKSETLEKKCPHYPIMFLILVDITELTTSLNLFGPRWHCNHFSKEWPKSKIKRNLLQKTYRYPYYLTSGVEMFLRCTIFGFGCFCLRELPYICMNNRKFSKMIFSKK